MAIRGLNLARTWDFQSKSDPDKGTDDASTFVLRTLDSRIMGRLRDGVTKVYVDTAAEKADDKAETQINMQAMNFETCQYGLDGWSNVLDDDGNEIEYKAVKKRMGAQDYMIVQSEVLRRIPGSVITEIAEELRKENELDDDAAGN